jgi:hypothetical protein
LVGLVVARAFLRDRVVVDRTRSISLALLTPFVVLRAGLLVDAKALVEALGVIVALLLVKLFAKLVAVRPASAAFLDHPVDGDRADVRVDRSAVRLTNSRRGIGRRGRPAAPPPPSPALPCRPGGAGAGRHSRGRITARSRAGRRPRVADSWSLMN